MHMRENRSGALETGTSRFDHEFFLIVQQLRGRSNPDKPLTSSRSEGYGYRRSQERSLRSISVSIQGLDDDFQPCGNLFWVVSRDVSMLGMGLISHEPFPHRYVRLGLMDQATSTIAKVCHNTAIGGKYPLYLVGVEFDGKLMDSNGHLRPVA